MGHVKEPQGVDFFVDSRPLTQEEKQQISDAIAYYKRTGRKKLPLFNFIQTHDHKSINDNQ